MLSQQPDGIQPDYRTNRILSGAKKLLAETGRLEDDSGVPPTIDLAVT